MKSLARTIKIISFFLLFIAVAVVLFMFVYPLIRSLGIIDSTFIFDSPKGEVLGEKGGIFPAIIGSIWFSGLALFLAFIPALACAINEVFYISDTRIKKAIRVLLENAAAVPSILFGLFVYAVFVFRLNIGRCILSASISLALMIFPYLERKFEKALGETDRKILAASTNLGLGKFYIIKKLILPSTYKEIISASILAFCFAMSATAPIIFTGGVAFAPVPNSILRPAMSLPLHVYLMIVQGETQVNRAYATVTVTLTMLLILHLIAGYLCKEKKNDK